MKLGTSGVTTATKQNFEFLPMRHAEVTLNLALFCKHLRGHKQRTNIYGEKNYTVSICFMHYFLSVFLSLIFSFFNFNF